MRPKQKRIDKELAGKLTDLILSGELKQVQVAQELGITRQAVNNWIVKRRHPERFILPHRVPSPPPKLSTKDARSVAAAIRRGPPSKYGLMFEEDVWVPIAVRDLIEDQLGQHVPIATVEELIEREKLPVEQHASKIEGILPRGRPWHKPLALPETPYKIGRKGGRRVATQPEPVNTEFYRAMLQRT